MAKVEATTTLGDMLDAIKELTKQVGELIKESKKLAEEIHIKVKAGRF